MRKKQMSKMGERLKHGALCPNCNSRCWVYLGRAMDGKGKHQFQCKMCHHVWQYGYGENKYTLTK